MPKPKKNEAKQDFLKRCTSELISDEGLEADQAFKLCNISYDDSKNQRSVLSLSRPVELAKKGEKGENRKFFINAYTGKPIDTWWGTLIFDINGMQSKEKMPILREHARDRVVGMGAAMRDKDLSSFMVEGEFSRSTADAAEVLNLADEGYPWQASVSIWPIKVKVLENSKAKETINGREIIGPAEIWQESEVGEVSFVSLGRDDDTAAIALSNQAFEQDTGGNFTISESKVPVEIEGAWNYITLNYDTDNQLTTTKECERMDYTLDVLKEKCPELLADIEAKAFEKGKAEGMQLERMRVIELLGADADAEQTKKAIEAGTETSEAYKQFFEAERANRAKGLKQLENSATETQGVEEPEVKEPESVPVDQKLAAIAKEIAAEKGISLREAQKIANQQNPELAKAWQPIGG